MAQKFKSIIVPATSHSEGSQLSAEWKVACLGTLSHGDIYRMGLLAVAAKLSAEKQQVTEKAN